MQPQSSQPQTGQSPQNSNLIEAEIQHNIPVKIHSSEDKNPIAALKQFVEHDNKNEDGLDQVLKDVNNSVKDTDKKLGKKSFFSFLKKPKDKKPEPVQPPQQPQQQLSSPPSAQAQQKEQTPGKPKKSQPIFVAIVAVIVTSGLSAVAFYAFSHSKTTADNKSGSSQSTQSSNSPQLTVEDLKDFSANMEASMNSLNDPKGFNQTDLSDSNLGL
jgi:hypothetical protein